MLFDISELDPAGLQLDETVQVPPFTWEGGDEVSCDAIRLTGWLRPTSRGIEIDARFGTVAHLRCTRCLAPLDRDLEGRMRLYLVPDVEPEDENEDGSLDEEAIDLFPLSGDKVDLAALMREQLDLALPYRVLCDEECQGLCPRCGVNLNQDACGCAPPDDEMRTGGLADLRRLLEDRKGEEPSGRK